jgi:hypothetical protein
MKFRTTLLSAGKTATGIQIPDEVVEALGSGKRPAVRVTINGHTYRSSVAVMGGVFMVGVSAENRASAGVAAGDELEVDLEMDTAPREVELPADFEKALDGDADAKRAFEAMNYSNKRRLVVAIEGIERAETRQRRVETTVGRLREGKA